MYVGMCGCVRVGELIEYGFRRARVSKLIAFAHTHTHTHAYNEFEPIKFNGFTNFPM